jgi:hypothetical protein
LNPVTLNGAGRVPGLAPIPVPSSTIPSCITRRPPRRPPPASFT